MYANIPQCKSYVDPNFNQLDAIQGIYRTMIYNRMQLTGESFSTEEIERISLERAKSVLEKKSNQIV